MAKKVANKKNNNNKNHGKRPYQQNNNHAKEVVKSATYTDGITVGELAAKLNEAMDRLSDCEGILVFSDLAGGSPFKTAVEVGLTKSNRVEVLAGTNLGMIIELAMARGFISDMDMLVDMALNTGKSQVVRFELVVREEVADEDGI